MQGISIWIWSHDLAFARGTALALKEKIGKRFLSADMLEEQEIRERLCSGEKPDADIPGLIRERLEWVSSLLSRNGAAAIAVSSLGPTGVDAPEAKDTLSIFVAPARGSYAFLDRIKAGGSPGEAAQRIANLLDRQSPVQAR